MRSHFHFQKGAILTMAGIMLPILLGFLGLGYDVGMSYLYKARLQNAADAAALAGLKELLPSASVRLLSPREISESDGHLQVNINGNTYQLDKVADPYAAEYASMNRVVNGYIERNRGGRIFGQPELYQGEDNINLYHLVLEDTYFVSFMRVLGFTTVEPRADAIAVAFGTSPGIGDFAAAIDKWIKETHKIADIHWEDLAAYNNAWSKEWYKEKMNQDKTEEQGWHMYRYAENHWNLKYTSLSEKTSDIVGYADPSLASSLLPGMDTSGGKYGVPVMGDTSKLEKCEYRFKTDGPMKWVTYNGNPTNDIEGVFLDKLAADQRGGRVRQTDLYIDWDIYPVYDAYMQKNNIPPEYRPLFVRIESEPVYRLPKPDGTYTAHYHMVFPNIVHISQDTTRLIVIAYNGPENVRTLAADAYPFKGYAWNAETNDWNYVKNTATYKNMATATAPFVLKLSSDFHGVIFAPWSKITIESADGENHKIKGFVLGREVEDTRTPKGTKVHQDRSSYEPLGLPSSIEAVYDEYSPSQDSIDEIGQFYSLLAGNS